MRRMDGDGEQKSTIVKCPHCSARVEIAPENLGRMHRCQCGGEFRAPSAKPERPLPGPRNALNRLSPKWRAVVGVSLGFIALVAALQLVNGIYWHLGVTDVEALLYGQPREGSVRELIKRLSRDDERVRESAVGLLGEKGERAIGPLIRALRSDDDRVRSSARSALAAIGESAVPALLKALVSRDIAVATEAARALGEIGDAQATELLIQEFKKHVLAEDLGAWRWFKRRRLDPDRLKMHSKAAEAMAKALGEIGAGEATDELVATLGHMGREMDRTIVEALNKIGPDALPALRADIWRMRPDVRAMVLEVTADPYTLVSEEEVLRRLMSDNGSMVSAAAQIMVSKGDTRAVPVLIKAVERGDHYAIEPLGAFGDARALPALATTLNHEKEYQRKMGAQALGKLGCAEAVEPLIGALDDESSEVVKVAIKALAEIGGKRAAKALVELLDHDRGSVRSSALDALGRMRGDGLEALVAGLASESTVVRSRTESALQRMDEEAIDALVAGLAKAGSEQRAEILRLLRARYEDPRAKAAIEQEAE